MRERVKQAWKEHMKDKTKFLKMKYYLTKIEKKNKNKQKAQKPFMCGTTTAKNANSKFYKHIEKDIESDKKLNIEELNLKQSLTKDKAEKLTMRVN